MKAKIALSVLIIIFVFAASLGATMAWFTDQAVTPENVFTAGTVEISADETLVINSEKMSNVNPGDCFVKCFEIENEGSKAIELRLKNFIGQWNFDNANDPVYLVPVPGSDWVMKYNEDETGFDFYYTGGPVPAGETVQLCILVIFDGEIMGNEFQENIFTLNGNFEAVQASNEAPSEVWGVDWDTDWFAMNEEAALLAGTDATYAAYFYEGGTFKFEPCAEETNGNGNGNGNDNGNGDDNGNDNGSEETAWGGDTEGDGAAWWYYYNTGGNETQTVWAGQTINIGSVTVSDPVNGEVTITINLDSGWALQAGNETVKIQGYAENDVPVSRPSAGSFDYKGNQLVVTVAEYDIYAIHLDVEGSN